MYFFLQPAPPGIDDIASIPLPGSIPLPPEKPTESKTEPTEPKPAEPKPTEPKPAEPEPTEPVAKSSASQEKPREATKRPHDQAYGGWETVQQEEEE